MSRFFELMVPKGPKGFHVPPESCSMDLSGAAKWPALPALGLGRRYLNRIMPNVEALHSKDILSTAALSLRMHYTLNLYVIYGRRDKTVLFGKI